MKIALPVLAALSLFMAIGPVAFANQNEAAANTVTTFIEALKAGDMDTLKTITDGELLERFNKMRNSDPDYKAFLIKRYAHMALNEMTFQHLSDDNVIALVKLSFDGATPELFKWTLSRPADGRWHIISESH